MYNTKKFKKLLEEKDEIILKIAHIDKQIEEITRTTEQLKTAIFETEDDCEILDSPEDNYENVDGEDFL